MAWFGVGRNFSHLSPPTAFDLPGTPDKIFSFTGQRAASCDFFYKKLNPVNRRQSEVLVDPKKDPFFQHFAELFSTVFQCLCIRVNAITFANLSLALQRHLYLITAFLPV
jgi:hypothetical protein